MKVFYKLIHSLNNKIWALVLLIVVALDFFFCYRELTEEYIEHVPVM